MYIYVHFCTFTCSAAWQQVKSITDENPGRQAKAQEAKMEELGLVAQIAITPFVHANPGKKMYKNVHLCTF